MQISAVLAKMEQFKMRKVYSYWLNLMPALDESTILDKILYCDAIDAYLSVKNMSQK